MSLRVWPAPLGRAIQTLWLRRAAIETGTIHDSQGIAVGDGASSTVGQGGHGGQGGQGGHGGEVYNYIYPPPSPLPPLQQNEALDVRISRLYEAVQHLEDRLYRKWHADEKMYTADVAQRAERQRATDHYRRLVLWWLGGLTGIVVVLIVVVTWVMFWLGVVLQRFGWL